ncbi:Hypothetical protein, putative [Bodo saltans]|uniref:AMMECR1 domain-containing protein n=1 Tax=Bodo saltans TaxID=75058 RepID=A0A0S4KMC2_BODSA|nr:Hypothetical protein, putative [Bodo saltans]|eukprot:CUI15535.1 Hypothetical protein, putative [Bodo saltans]
MRMEATQIMVAYCFRSVSERLMASSPKASGLSPALTSSIAAESFETMDAPVFVCFKHATTNRLRGCVGTFTPGPLKDQLRKYACAAAFEDSRFKPLSSEAELSTLRCNVSLLHTFEVLPQGDWDRWEVGVHGIQASLASGGRHLRGTFLPSVAKEQRWDQRTTVTHLLHKAGLEGAVNDDVLRQVELTRYQESSSSSSYEELFLPGTKPARMCSIS